MAARPPVAPSPSAGLPRLKVTLRNCSYGVVKQAAKDLGFRRIKNSPQLAWLDKWTPQELFDLRSAGVRVNHFPGTREMANKCSLARNLNAMRESSLSESFGFHPRSWVWPAERRSVEDACDADGSIVLIAKPDAACQGRGIFLAKSARDLPSASELGGMGLVVQEYVPRPLLLRGHKFDLRVYVLLTGVYPSVRAFVHVEGLTRLAARVYAEPTAKNLRRRTMHLTNYAVNKGRAFEEKEGGGEAAAGPDGERDDDEEDGDGDGDGAAQGAGWAVPLTAATEAEADGDDEAACETPAGTAEADEEAASEGPPTPMRAAPRGDRSRPSTGSSSAGSSSPDDVSGRAAAACAAGAGGRYFAPDASGVAALEAREGGKWGLQAGLVAAAEEATAAAGGGDPDAVSSSLDRMWASIRDASSKTVMAVVPSMAHEYLVSVRGAGSAAAKNAKAARAREEAEAARARGEEPAGEEEADAAAADAPGAAFGSGAGLSEHGMACFELLGLDVLLDDDGRCLLLEVNKLPSLNSDTAVDRAAKRWAVGDALRMVAPPSIAWLRRWWWRRAGREGGDGPGQGDDGTAPVPLPVPVTALEEAERPLVAPALSAEAAEAVFLRRCWEDKELRRSGQGFQRLLPSPDASLRAEYGRILEVAAAARTGAGIGGRSSNAHDERRAAALVRRAAAEAKSRGLEPPTPTAASAGDGRRADDSGPAAAEPDDVREGRERREARRDRMAARARRRAVMRQREAEATAEEAAAAAEAARARAEAAGDGARAEAEAMAAAVAVCAAASARGADITAVAEALSARRAAAEVRQQRRRAGFGAAAAAAQAYRVGALPAEPQQRTQPPGLALPVHPSGRAGLAVAVSSFSRGRAASLALSPRLSADHKPRAEPAAGTPRGLRVIGAVSPRQSLAGSAAHRPPTSPVAARGRGAAPPGLAAADRGPRRDTTRRRSRPHSPLDPGAATPRLRAPGRQLDPLQRAQPAAAASVPTGSFRIVTAVDSRAMAARPPARPASGRRHQAGGGGPALRRIGGERGAARLSGAAGPDGALVHRASSWSSAVTSAGAQQASKAARDGLTAVDPATRAAFADTIAGKRAGPRQQRSTRQSALSAAGRRAVAAGER